MEFCEKLQELRKSKGLTQEELARALFVSRTAVSKWESNRGWPSIDSRKEISAYFSVSIDDLLSTEKLISIAEKENKNNIRNICNTLFGVVDLFSVMLILLPLYPKTVDEFVYAVNLLVYAETSVFNIYMYWTMFSLLIVCGMLQICCAQFGESKWQKITTAVSLTLSTGAVMYLSLAREAYAVTLVFVLLVVKCLLIFKTLKT